MDSKFALKFWFKIFSFIIILITFQAVLSEFSRCFKCILNIFENQQKIKKIHKFCFFIFSKKFLHNHYLKLFLDWFTRNVDFNCGGWTCGMKSVAPLTPVLALYNIFKENASQGLPGCLRSIYCMHVGWKNFPR